MVYTQRFNPYAAELFHTIFHSFEGGIAHAISSSEHAKRQNHYIINAKICLQNVIIRLNKLHLPQFFR